MKENVRDSDINHGRQHEVQHGISRDINQDPLRVSDHVDVNLREIGLQSNFAKPAKETKII